MTDYVLGVDIGSGSVKLTLLSREGKIAATAGCEYPTYYPHVGWCEQDPEDWCRAFKTAFGDILKTAGVGAERIKALSFDAATTRRCCWASRNRCCAGQSSGQTSAARKRCRS